MISSVVTKFSEVAVKSRSALLGVNCGKAAAATLSMITHSSLKCTARLPVRFLGHIRVTTGHLRENIAINVLIDCRVFHVATTQNIYMTTSAAAQNAVSLTPSVCGVKAVSAGDAYQQPMTTFINRFGERCPVHPPGWMTCGPMNHNSSEPFLHA